MTRIGHRIEQAEIRTVIEIVTAETEEWLPLGAILEYCRGFKVIAHVDCVRSVLQRMWEHGEIKRRTVAGDFQYKANFGTTTGEMVHNRDDQS